MRTRRAPSPLAVLTALVVSLGALLIVPGSAHATTPHDVQPASEKHPGITFGDNCLEFGPTCTTTFGRKYTHDVLAPAAGGTASGLTAAMVSLCTAVGGTKVGAGCGTLLSMYAGASTAAIAQAAAQNQCASYTTYFTDAIAIWHTNFGPDCQP